MRLEPTEADKAFIKDPLDQDIVAMTRAFRIVAMQTLKLADKAGIDHLKVYFAMLNGASDSTPEIAPTPAPPTSSPAPREWRTSPGRSWPRT